MDEKKKAAIEAVKEAFKAGHVVMPSPDYVSLEARMLAVRMLDYPTSTISTHRGSGKTALRQMVKTPRFSSMLFGMGDSEEDREDLHRVFKKELMGRWYNSPSDPHLIPEKKPVALPTRPDVRIYEDPAWLALSTENRRRTLLPLQGAWRAQIAAELVRVLLDALTDVQYESAWSKEPTGQLSARVSTKVAAHIESWLRPRSALHDVLERDDLNWLWVGRPGYGYPVVQHPVRGNAYEISTRWKSLGQLAVYFDWQSRERGVPTKHPRYETYEWRKL